MEIAASCSTIFSQSNLESTAAAKPMQTILSVQLEKFQQFKVLRLTIENHHRDSGLHLLITLSRKRRIQLFATLGDELFCHDGR